MATLLALLAALLGFAQDAAPEKLLVQLRPKAAVTRSPVLLSDVADLLGPPTEVARFGKLEICPAPSAGKPRFVSAAGVCLAARLAGMALDADRLVGAAQVEVTANWNELSSEELFQQAQRFVLAQSAELGDRILLERALRPAPMPLLDGAGDAEFHCAFVQKSQGARQVQVKVTVSQGGSVVGDRQVGFRVRRFGRQLRLLTDVRRGEPIAPVQVLSSDGEWTAIEGLPVMAETELAGMVAVRDLVAGTALTRDLIEPPQLAAKGDSVQILLKSGALQITLVGTAQRGGRRGDVVPVINPTTQKVIQAELVARNAAGLAVAVVR
ncbi:MAG: flagellar basal body P-ring formation protein FlgA [Planctomycetes bacterium]|nr:flagellar basal body P-ring formation protein FlgA [Planctomycetota bacterium]